MTSLLSGDEDAADEGGQDKFFAILWLAYVVKHGTKGDYSDPDLFVDKIRYSTNANYERYGALTALYYKPGYGWRVVSNRKLLELCTRFLPAEEVQLAIFQSELKE